MPQPAGADLEINRVAGGTLSLSVGSGADLHAAGTCTHLTASASFGANVHVHAR